MFILISVLCYKAENKTILFYTQPVDIWVVLLGIVYSTIHKKLLVFKNKLKLFNNQVILKENLLSTWTQILFPLLRMSLSVNKNWNVYVSSWKLRLAKLADTRKA